MSLATGLSEVAAIVRARAFVRNCQIDAVPVDLNRYLEAANADLRANTRLAPGEAGNTLFVKGRHLITVNANDTAERRRFTVLHEIAHIHLELPSVHGDGGGSSSLYSYARRPPEEILCDVFAAECLLPQQFLFQDLKDAVAGFTFIDEMAQKYEASLSCTASRVAINAPFPCTYVLSQSGFVRFVTSSASMRESGFRVSIGVAVPSASITGQCLADSRSPSSGVVGAHLWTSADGYVDLDVSEETRLLKTWGQALTLIWPESGDTQDLGRREAYRGRDEEEPLLKELDGVLPWPGKSKRRS
jgi:Zn-dependent peptidase ImmA (M78 family)